MLISDIISSAQRAGKVTYAGKSLYGHPIPMIRLGAPAAGAVLIAGTVHAREHITGRLLTELASRYSGEYPVDVVPYLNPDGAILATEGLTAFALKNAERLRLLKLNGGSTDFSLWKANLRGVDLNVNFDAGWGTGAKNVKVPGSENYIGSYPFSEPETRIVRSLIKSGRYAVAVAYHSKGEEVYWGFGQNNDYRDEAEKIARLLGYKPKQTPDSAGGLKDYWIQETGLPGFTVEVGKDSFPHPYPESELDNLIRTHAGAFGLYAEIAERVWKRTRNTT